MTYQNPLLNPLSQWYSVERSFEVRTDGYLLTSIIHPSYKIAQGNHQEEITTSTGERMPDHSDVMTVRQLIDLARIIHKF